MTIKEIKKELGVTDKDIAEFFQYKNTPAYSKSSAKPRIEAGIVEMYNQISVKDEKEKLAKAYNAAWRKSKKYAKKTNFHGLNSDQVRELFEIWYANHMG